MRIAVDAMGGDRAPGEIVAGAIRAAASEDVGSVLLVGDRERMASHLPDPLPPRVSHVQAGEVVEMDMAPAQAVRRLRDSSIVRCLELLRNGEADALVSAGHTGALVAGASIHLDLIKGVKRPGIAVDLPTPRGRCLVIDAGANLAAKPIHLFHYGVMGTRFVQLVRGEEKPTVGILSIGAERGKGNELVRRTRELFEASDVDFVGNVEGHEIFLGRASVVVCEGFVGNVLLKVSEGLALATVTVLRTLLAQEVTEPAGRQALEPALARFEGWADYSTYGGAPLLGVRETCFVCHGKSTSRAIENAVREAARMARAGVTAAIQEAVAGRPHAAGILEKWKRA